LLAVGALRPRPDRRARHAAVGLLVAAAHPAVGRGGGQPAFREVLRNLIYWLTETSAIGRRRLVATTDKRHYRPGESLSISAHTYDEAAGRTGRYRVVVMHEPRQLTGDELPPCPVKWPVGRPRTPGQSCTLAEWGEDIPLTLDPQSKDHTLTLPLVEALAKGAAGQAFKLELTAYEGQTQIDSSSLDVQVLSDPHEQQNPLPNRECLTALARSTGGREFANANELAEALRELPVNAGPESVRCTPLWSREWILGGLLALLAVEWFWRRWLGLA
jgi:hypothetical protein